MKDKIHPQYNSAITVSCACGKSFTTGSTLTEIHTEICKECHPFYTGKQKLVDTTGLVERFQKRKAHSETLKATAVVKKPRKVRAKA